MAVVKFRRTPSDLRYGTSNLRYVTCIEIRISGRSHVIAVVGAATDSMQLLGSRVHGDYSHHVLVHHVRVGRTLEYATHPGRTYSRVYATSYPDSRVYSALVVVDSRVRPT